MDGKRFDDIVKNQANRVVQQRIKAFRHAVHAALMGLLPGLPGYGVRDAVIDGKSIPVDIDNADAGYKQTCIDMRKCIDNLMTGGTTWPARLWREEEEKASKSILAQLDIVQQACMAPPPADTDDKPAEGASTP